MKAFKCILGYRLFKILLIIALIFLLSSCTDNNSLSQQSYKPEFTDIPHNKANTEYIFGVHPLHNPQRLQEVFGPLMTYLSVNIPNAQFKLEASRNYASYDQKLYAQKFHFSLPNPFQTINAVDKGYQVFGKMADDENFRGIIIVRKDSGIEKETDLIGKSVSYPAPTALAATMMPQYYLQTHGVDVMNDLDNQYVGSQESSIMNVYLKNTAAGATWPPPWEALSDERPELKKELKVIWTTSHLPNNSLIVLSDVPQSIVNNVSELLFDFHNTDEGKQILSAMHLSRFETANNNTYDSVRDFVRQFSEKVRPIN